METGEETVVLMQVSCPEELTEVTEVTSANGIQMECRDGHET